MLFEAKNCAKISASEIQNSEIKNIKYIKIL